MTRILIRIPWIRIGLAPLDPDSDLDPLWGKKLDPDPHWNQCGSETLVSQKVVISFLILDFFDFCIDFYHRSGSKSGTGMYYGSSSAMASSCGSGSKTLYFFPISCSSSRRSSPPSVNHYFLNCVRFKNAFRLHAALVCSERFFHCFFRTMK